MKLKLNTKMSMPPPSLPGDGGGSQTPAQTPGKISLKLHTPVSQTPNASTPKASKKRKSTNDDEGRATVKKHKAQSSAGSATPNILRLKTGKGAETPKTAATHLSFNFKGKPPPRPLGVGYDSEAEDAEEDPSIEENIVLRMKPGPDCELLRKAIDQRLVGADKKEGGIGVSLRFFGRDGRRAAVTVQNNVYGAVLVDLPCIIESMKSWDKKGWWKSADICQMLLVLDQIPDQETARTMPLPAHLDQKTWQWPHGLTPPLHNVRTRRFRQRVNHRTIEAAENEVDRLMAEDDRIEALNGGSTSFEILDPEDLRDDNDDIEEEDGEGEYYEDSQLVQPDGYFEEDNDAMAEKLAMELGDGFDDEEDELANAAPTVETGGVSGTPSMRPDSAVPPTPIQPTDDAPSPAVNGTDSGDAQEDADADEDDESGEDYDDDDDDDDDEERERLDARQQALEDCEDLRTKIIHSREQLTAAKNPILQERYAHRISELKAELALKLPHAGLDPDEAENF